MLEFRVNFHIISICNEVGKKKLPSHPKQTSPTIDHHDMDLPRSKTKKAPIQRVQLHQNNQRQTYDRLENVRNNKTLSEFEKKSRGNPKNAWNLMKELSGKKIFSPNKAPGLDGLTLEVWKLKKTQKHLRSFCIETFNGERPNEWGISGIVPVPKKRDLTRCTNYRGISLSQIASQTYNRLMPNRIRPVIDKLLRPNQNGFRPRRSVSSHLLALRRIIEELRNHKKEAVITFIDFKKAFDSIDRSKMLKILVAYGIPSEIVNAIRVMYENTFALVVTSEGNTDILQVDTGVLQEDPLAPFLFITCLDYTLGTSIFPPDGLTLKRKGSRRVFPEKLAELAFADDITLMEDTINKAESLLHKIETTTQKIGLFLKANKTKAMHFNPSVESYSCYEWWRNWKGWCCL